MNTYHLYDGQVELQFGKKKGPKGRMKQGYWIGDEQVIRVTGVQTPVPFMAAAYYGSGLAADKFLELFKVGELDDLVPIDDIAKQLRKAAGDTTKRDLGTLGHNWLEGYARHKAWGGSHPGPMPRAIKPQLEQMVDWWPNIEVIHEVECKVYSKQFQYAGTLDIDATIGGQRQIVDYKFGAIRDSVRIQTAAYQYARQEELGIKYDSRRVISLTEDGLNTEVYHDFEKDFGAFKNLLEYTRWQQSL